MPDEISTRRQRIYRAMKLDQLSPGMRRIVVGIIGGTILLIGIALTVLPGPAFVVVPLGLAVLATEFRWAARALLKARAWFVFARRKVAGRRRRQAH